MSWRRNRMNVYKVEKCLERLEQLVCTPLSFWDFQIQAWPYLDFLTKEKIHIDIERQVLDNKQ